MLEDFTAGGPVPDPSACRISHPFVQRNAISKLFPIFGGFNEEYSLTLEFTIQSPSDSHYWYSHLHFGGKENPEIDYVNSFMPRGPSKLRSSFSPEEPEYWGYLGRLFAMLNPTFRELVVPEVPAVQKFILRRQSRRQFRPWTLKALLAKFPQIESLV
ncbi:hypothetical protein LZL87_004280 [Fusarium oxysporum]|nr:hypothetical protein LZL87_004280 [Fusarium oxysporum]